MPEDEEVIQSCSGPYYQQRVKAIENILTAGGIDSDRLVDTKVEYVGDQKPNVVRSRLATASLM